jgi:hypothetical protein
LTARAYFEQTSRKHAKNNLLFKQNEVPSLKICIVFLERIMPYIPSVESEDLNIESQSINEQIVVVRHREDHISSGASDGGFFYPYSDSSIGEMLGLRQNGGYISTLDLDLFHGNYLISTRQNENYSELTFTPIYDGFYDTNGNGQYDVNEIIQASDVTVTYQFDTADNAQYFYNTFTPFGM